MLTSIHRYAAGGRPGRARGASVLGALLLAALGALPLPARAETQARAGGAGARAPAGGGESTPPALDISERSFRNLVAARLVYDLELRAGVGWATLSSNEVKVADFLTGCADLSLGLGTMLSPWVKLGYEATLGVRSVLGGRRTYEQNESQVEASELAGNTTWLLPLGGSLEVFPWQGAGASVSLHAGVGTFWPAEYLRGGNIELAGMLAADLGYEHAWSESSRWSVRLRYGATGLGRFHIDESYSDTQNSSELTLAVRVSAY